MSVLECNVHDEEEVAIRVEDRWVLARARGPLSRACSAEGRTRRWSCFLRSLSEKGVITVARRDESIKQRSQVTSTKCDFNLRRFSAGAKQAANCVQKRGEWPNCISPGWLRRTVIPTLDLRANTIWRAIRRRRVEIVHVNRSFLNSNQPSPVVDFPGDLRWMFLRGKSVFFFFFD